MKILRLLAVIATLVLLFQRPALAQTFGSTSANILNTGFDAGDLLPRFTESGLVPNSSVNYSITGTVTSTYACVRGRRLADKLDPLSVNFDRRFTLPASGRGIVGQTVEIEEPDPEVGSCRAEGKTVLYQVEYDDVNIHDLTNGVEAVIGGGTFSLIFCDLNKNPQNCPPPS